MPEINTRPVIRYADLNADSIVFLYGQEIGQESLLNLLKTENYLG